MTPARIGMTPALKWAFCLGLAPAALLASLASFAVPPLSTENRRFAGDAAQMRIDFPQLFRSDVVDMKIEPKALARGLRGACDAAASDLCYEAADRRIVLRPVRQYMPKVDGFTAESVSLRRNSIRFRYSFK
jgi:hypothetical protein